MTGQNPKSDRKVEGGTFLFDVGGGEVDGDFIGRDLETTVFNGRSDSFPGFSDAGVRKADQDELREAVTDIDFNVDRESVDTESKSAFDADHVFPRLSPNKQACFLNTLNL